MDTSWQKGFQVIGGHREGQGCRRHIIRGTAPRLFVLFTPFLLLPPPVRQDVAFQIAALVAAVRAQVAGEGFVLGVNLLVAFQVARTAAGEGAELAVERLLPGVGQKMTFEVDKLRGSVEAVRAAEGLLPVVSLHVPLEVAGVMGGEGTQAAGEE